MNYFIWFAEFLFGIVIISFILIFDFVEWYIIEFPMIFILATNCLWTLYLENFFYLSVAWSSLHSIGVNFFFFLMNTIVLMPVLISDNFIVVSTT